MKYVESAKRITPYIHPVNHHQQHQHMKCDQNIVCLRVTIYAHIACMHIPLVSIKTNLIEMTLTRAKCRNNTHIDNHAVKLEEFQQANE